MSSLQPDEDDIRKVWFSAGRAFKAARRAAIAEGAVTGSVVALNPAALQLFMQATRDPSVYIALAVVNLAIVAIGGIKRAPLIPPANDQ